MAGHSHWAGIKHKKAANDAKRGKIWSKVARVIIMAAKAGGGDPDQNLALRYAIEKAKASNMPKDTIEKAIKKGTGNLDGVTYEEILYEAYGCNGVAIMCEILTDNRNRTAPELRKVFENYGGSLGTSGCVAWMFTRKGTFAVDASTVDEDTVMEIALEAGAEDFENSGDSYEITCDPDSFDEVKNALAQKGIETTIAELAQVPSTLVELDEKGARKILKLIEKLDDHEDVQNVFANFDIPEDIAKKIAEEE